MENDKRELKYAVNYLKEVKYSPTKYSEETFVHNMNFYKYKLDEIQKTRQNDISPGRTLKVLDFNSPDTLSYRARDGIASFKSPINKKTNNFFGTVPP